MTHGGFWTSWAMRFAKFGLELHPDKARLIEFGRVPPGDRLVRGLR